PKEAVPRPSKVRLMGLSIECSPNPRLRLNDGLYLTPGLRPTPLRPLRSRSIKSLSSWPRRLGAALRLISSSNFTRFGSNIGPPVWAAEQISECLSKSPTAGHVAHHGDPFVKCDPQRIDRSDRLHETIAAWHILPLRDVGPENPIKNDEHTAVVSIEVDFVARVMDTMIGRRVQNPVDKSQLRNEFGVNPGLVDEVERERRNHGRRLKADPYQRQEEQEVSRQHA